MLIDSCGLWLVTNLFILILSRGFREVTHALLGVLMGAGSLHRLLVVSDDRPIIAPGQ